MATREIERDQWDKYTSSLSRRLRKEEAQLQLGGLALNQLIEADHLPLRGISYDRRKDTLEIELEGLSHSIAHPERIRVVETDSGFERMEVVDRDGNRQVLQLDRALAK